MDAYEKLESLGEGSFGRVYRGRRRFTGQFVALKLVPKANKSQLELEALQREVRILTHLDHPNIIKLLDYFETPSDVVLVMEWMQDARQIDAMNALFPGRTVVAAKHMLRGDKKAKERLQAQLAPNEQQMRDEIAKFNKYDILLWDFAQSLLARRLRVLQGIATSAHKAGPFTEEKTAHAECGAHSHSVHGRLERDLTSQLGIFRPPGHKGPF